MRTATPGDALIDHFSVFEDNGYAKRSGLTSGDFTTSVWANGAVVPTATSIIEISGGEYQLGFIPTIVGIWKVEVLVNYNKEILVTEVEVRELDVDAIGDILNDIKDGNTGSFDPTTDSLHQQTLTLDRILGLLHHNAILDNQQYDADGQLVGARLRVFDSRANVPNTPGGNETTGLLHRYTIEAAYVGFGASNLFRLLRDV